MRVITSEKLPVKMWTRDVEQGAMDQIINLANFPFAFGHIVILPDCHQGFGMPIGGVLPTEKVIVPNAVGVDIGCGMTAVRTSLTNVKQDVLKMIMAEIRRQVPLGFKHHEKAQDTSLMPDLRSSEFKIHELTVLAREYKNALYQLGTLGGGNHFIEIQKGADNFIWVMVHSGSRNIGKQVADFYNRLAVELNKKWNIRGTSDKQLAFLYLDSTEGQKYMAEMNYCIDFAFASRRLMLDRIMSIVADYIKDRIQFAEPINIAHNFASQETYHDHKLIIHRKGATQAFNGQLGIIPGSQGTESYIVRGKGNEESFNSCSHGAGRILGRRQAQRQLDLEKERASLEKKNILHSIFHKSDLDEAPGAYKNIKQVMAQQSDLVDILVELHPLAVIKG